MHSSTAASGLAAGTALKITGADLALSVTPSWGERARAFVFATWPGTLLTADDIVEAVGLPVGSSMNRAVGGLVLALRREGLLVPTGEYTQSTRKVRHAGPIQVWRRA